MLIICDGSGLGGCCLVHHQRVERSDALRTALFVLLALPHDGRAETGAEVLGQFVELGVSIDLDGLLGSVTDHIAIVAPGKMVLQLDLCGFVEDAVQDSWSTRAKNQNISLFAISTLAFLEETS
jgi:hypothetical protein